MSSSTEVIAEMKPPREFPWSRWAGQIAAIMRLEVRKTFIGKRAILIYMLAAVPILLNNGYVVAEGEIHGVRSEMEEHPMQILIRCDRPGLLAARVFEQDSVVEAKIHKDKHGLFIKTRDADAFYILLNTIVVEDGLTVESIAPVDDDINAVYQYLIGGGEAA